jgi:hypothetical protein
VNRESTDNLLESRVVKIWQDCLTGRNDLFTEDKKRIEVVYPGRLNDDRGADLRDAVITSGHCLRKGEVEIHVRSSSWWGHKHHQDPLYNGVILHVVYRHDTAAVVTLQNGCEVPTLALEKYVSNTGPFSRRPLPCRKTIDPQDQAFIGEILNRAGDNRFATKLTEFQEALSRVGAEQALYRGIMAALGYIKNKIPMIELARRLPLSMLMAAVPAEITDEECLVKYQALLIGTAGLLPSQHGGQCWPEYPYTGWIERLEDAWAALGQADTMLASDWHSFKIRPNNLPRRRLAAMSYLLGRYRENGLLPVLIGEVENVSPERNYLGLRDWLLVNTAGFWEENLDFGLPARRITPALLGEDRAGIIVVNVLLPLAAAWAQAALRPKLAEKVLEIYHRYPALAENTVEKHMRRQLGIAGCSVSSAQRQQGLLHIYKTLCAQGKCGECPLGQ